MSETEKLDRADELRTQLHKCEAAAGHGEEPPPALVREHLEGLLRDLVGEPLCARKHLRPAIDSIVRALRGRWSDEAEPDPARLQRIREITVALPRQFA